MHSKQALSFEKGSFTCVFSGSAATPSSAPPFIYFSRTILRWPLPKRRSKGKEERKKRLLNFILMQCQGEPGSDRGQMYHREIHAHVEKCMEGNHGGLCYTAPFTLPPNPAGEPMNHWTTAPPVTPPCVYTAANLWEQQHPPPRCAGTMSFLKVISSLVLGQPSSWVHYTHTESGEIHRLNTPLLVSSRCFTASFNRLVQTQRRPRTQTSTRDSSYVLYIF